MPDRLRLILGVKLRALRQGQRLGLKAVAKKAGLSVSYLSEIEQGKKYPRADKLVDLAHALGVPYDDLVSLRVDRGLDAVKDAIESPFLRAFPFALFGVEPEAVVNLLAGMADRGEALVRALTDLGRAYDGRVEDVLMAALRAYQQMHANRFPELEATAERLRTRLRLGPSPTAAALRAALEAAGTRVETGVLAADPDLAGLRSVLVPGSPTGGGPTGGGPTLHVNGRLLDEQLAFVYARELGFLELGATDRPLTSSWLQVDRFEQVLDNFRGSYVAGALLLPAVVVDAALVGLADAPAWDARGLAHLLARTRSTPEMLFHRLTQRVPEALGLDELFFLRMHQPAGLDERTLTKSFNLSRVPVPHGVADDEHYCRRWADSVALRELDRREARAAGRGEPAGPGGDVVVVAQRQHFLAENAEFFVVSVARPLSLQPGMHSAVSLGVLRTRATRRRIRFWDDPALPVVDVSLTCERCPLADCRVRAAPPRLVDDAAERRTAALARLGAGT